MASFNTPTALGYMTRYLDHYLDQPDLWFEQGEVMAGVDYLDRLNGTHLIDTFRDRWVRFTSDKPNWSLERTSERFDRELEALTSLRRAYSSGVREGEDG